MTLGWVRFIMLICFIKGEIMFTIDIVLGVLKKVFGGLFSFLWEYKGWIIIAIVIGVLYIRGNNYRDDYQQESVAHNNTVLQYDKQLSNIRLANETALRIAQEESAANYKALVEKTSKIQKEYSQREEDINTTITKLNSSNNSLRQSISEYTKRDTNSSSGESVSDSSNAYRLQLAGELLEQCIGRKQYYAEESEKLNNSVITLVEWGNAIIEQNKGEKDE